jgi:hypothetical protein
MRAVRSHFGHGCVPPGATDLTYGLARAIQAARAKYGRLPDASRAALAVKVLLKVLRQRIIEVIRNNKLSRHRAEVPYGLGSSGDRLVFHDNDLNLFAFKGTQVRPGKRVTIGRPRYVYPAPG